MIRGGQLALGVALVSGCADERGPRISAVSPEAAPHDAMVEILGRRLCGATGNCALAGGEVQLGLALPAVRANTVEYSDTRAVIVIPSTAPIGSTEIVIVVNEHASNAVAFEVIP